jgi:preprotein translocase subunit YajC
MRIITAGGMYGTIKKVNMEDGSVDVEISKGVVINVDKNYVFANAAAQQTK